MSEDTEIHQKRNIETGKRERDVAKETKWESVIFGSSTQRYRLHGRRVFKSQQSKVWIWIKKCKVLSHLCVCVCVCVFEYTLSVLWMCVVNGISRITSPQNLSGDVKFWVKHHTEKWIFYWLQVYLKTIRGLMNGRWGLMYGRNGSGIWRRFESGKCTSSISVIKAFGRSETNSHTAKASP